jgi:FkbM family methyltransferase
MRARLVAHPWIAPLKPALLRARCLRQPVRFFVREASGRRVQARYQLRTARDAHVVLRHGSPDVEAFDEIFVQRIYDVPEPVEQALALGRPPRLVDLGANVGLFAAWASAHWPGAAITCVEPDRFNLVILERAAAANGGTWTLVAAAAGAAEGELRFLEGRFATSRAAAVEEAALATTVPMRDVLPLMAAADFAKVDIEGSEWPILADPRLGGLATRAIALEYHPQGCPTRDARTEAHRLLGAAGYAVRDVETQAPPGYGSVWAWRTSP